jgi:hypothetical protein
MEPGFLPFPAPAGQKPTTMTDDERSPKRALRVSLRTLLVLTAFVAMMVSLLVSTGNNRRLARVNESLVAENRRLRDEVGELSIDDEGRLHAIRTSADSYLEWTWRVWIPKGREYRLRCVASDVPAKGWPTGTGASIMRLPAGEQVIRYRIRRDPRDGRFYGDLSTSDGSVGHHEHPWVEWPSRVSTTGGVGTTTRAYEADRIVELCRHRVSQASSSEDIEDPSAGFLIWFERVK